MKHLPFSLTHFAPIARTIAYSGGILVLLAGGAAAYASNSSISIQALSPGTTVEVGTPMTFSMATSGFTSTPSYTLSDSFYDGSLGKYNLSESGQFSWTPAPNDVGTHNVVIVATDYTGDAATLNLTLTVTSASASVVSASSSSSSSASLTIGTPYPSTNLIPGQTVSFGVVTSGFSGTPIYSITDSFSGGTLSSADLNSAGSFSWTPSTTDLGTHTVTVRATDSYGNSAQSSILLNVTSTPTTPVSTPATVVTPAVPVTPVTPATAFTEYLTPGSSDDQVTALQQMLTSVGDFSGPITGYFGSLTETAVEKFQSDHDLSPLGVVGPATRALLNSLEASSTSSVSTTGSSTTGSTGALTISQIETEIQTLGSQLSQIESQLSQLVGQ